MLITEHRMSLWVKGPWVSGFWFSTQLASWNISATSRQILLATPKESFSRHSYLCFLWEQANFMDFEVSDIPLRLFEPFCWREKCSWEYSMVCWHFYQKYFSLLLTGVLQEGKLKMDRNRGNRREMEWKRNNKLKTKQKTKKKN